MEIEIIIVSLLCIVILLLLKNIDLYAKIKEIKQLKSDNEQLKRMNALYKSAYDSVKNMNMYHWGTNKFSNYNTSNMGQNISIDKDIKDAIKLARDKSHPDNGGSSDDFIRFQELYRRICK